MKKIFLMSTIYLMFSFGYANATFVSGSTEADGPLILSNPPQQSQLPQNSIINGSAVEIPLPASGIFNFTTVNIPSGVTVTFKKNASNTPVHILTTGDATIAGTINVNGESTTSSTGTAAGKGGTGGYNGGNAGASGMPGGKGLGPGGGAGAPVASNNTGGGGGFGTPGSPGYGGGAGGSVYGNAKIIPLIGGSGGGGVGNYGYGGGGGGGAILIASSTTINITGSITANGGNGYNTAGGGSGGAVKLQANIIIGNGSIPARGGSSGYGGGTGRIRIEAYTNNRTSDTDPPYTFGTPESIFVGNAPALTITSIGGTNVPSSPTGAYATPDITLPSATSNPVTVAVSGANIPVGTAVMVRAVPQYGSETMSSSTLSGTLQSSTATVNVDISTTYSNVLSAEATYTVTGMFWNGEEIDRVRVAATMGGESQTTYITKSGKEIKGDMLAMVVRK